MELKENIGIIAIAVLLTSVINIFIPLIGSAIGGFATVLLLRQMKKDGAEKFGTAISTLASIAIISAVVLFIYLMLRPHMVNGIIELSGGISMPEQLQDSPFVDGGKKLTNNLSELAETQKTIVAIASFFMAVLSIPLFLLSSSIAFKLFH